MLSGCSAPGAPDTAVPEAKGRGTNSMRAKGSPNLLAKQRAVTSFLCPCLKETSHKAVHPCTAPGNEGHS